MTHKRIINLYEGFKMVYITEKINDKVHREYDRLNSLPNILMRIQENVFVPSFNQTYMINPATHVDIYRSIHDKTRYYINSEFRDLYKPTTLEGQIVYKKDEKWLEQKKKKGRIIL